MKNPISLGERLYGGWWGIWGLVCLVWSFTMPWFPLGQGMVRLFFVGGAALYGGCAVAIFSREVWATEYVWCVTTIECIGHLIGGWSRISVLTLAVLYVLPAVWYTRKRRKELTLLASASSDQATA